MNRVINYPISWLTRDTEESIIVEGNDQSLPTFPVYYIDPISKEVEEESAYKGDAKFGKHHYYVSLFKFNNLGKYTLERNILSSVTKIWVALLLEQAILNDVDISVDDLRNDPAGDLEEKMDLIALLDQLNDPVFRRNEVIFPIIVKNKPEDVDQVIKQYAHEPQKICPNNGFYFNDKEIK